VRKPFAKAGFVVLVVVLLATALAASASAAGVETHYFSGSIGEHELLLQERSGVVFDKATEELYVADTGHDRIARYGAAGEPLGAFPALTEPTFLALDNSSGDLYAVEEGNETITKLDSSGAPITTWGTAGRLGGFGKIAGIAADQSGNLFVVGVDRVMHELTPTGGQTNQCELPYRMVFGNNFENQLNAGGIAVDSEDDIYFPYQHPAAGNSGFIIRAIAKMTSTCVGLIEVFNAQGNSSAIDESDQSMFFAAAGEIGAGLGAGGALTHFSSDRKQIGRTFGGTREEVQEAGQLAVRSSDEAVYLVNLGTNDISVFTVGEIEPPQVQILPPTEVKGTTALLGATIDPRGELPVYSVLYDFECVDVSTGGEPFSCLAGEMEPGLAPETKGGTATGLQPATEYEVYVEARNLSGATARSPELPEVGLPFQTGAASPLIEEEAISGATESSVGVVANVNPRGAETGYLVEYVPRSQFEASEFAGAQSTPEQFLPPGIKAEPVSVTIEGLASQSPYVVRLVATNTVEGSVETVLGEALNASTAGPSLLPLPGSCPINETFRAFAGAILPDCRAYEQASPTDKSGGSVEATTGAVQAPAMQGEEGGAITFYSQAGIPGGVGAQDYPTFMSSRAGGSWSTQGLLAPQSAGEFAGFLGLTPDGRYALDEVRSEARGTGLFARDLTNGELITVVPYNAGCGQNCFGFAGASTDGSIIILESELELDKDPPTAMGPPNLYAWDRETGQISLVSADPSGARLPEGAYPGPFDWPQEDLDRGGSREQFYVSAIHAVSSDGTKAVFTERGENGSGQLYVRLDIGSPSARTVKVSAYAAGRTGPELPAAFLEATPEGRFIFFKSEALLTKDSYAGEGTESLFRYDTSSGKLVDVTSGTKAKFQAGPGVLGMLGASESGQVAYFASTTALTAAVPGPGGKTAVEGEANIFRWQEGASPAISFVATVENGEIFGAGSLESEGSDSRDWSPAANMPNEFFAIVTTKKARVSADGSSVLFSAHRSLTGSPNLARGCNRSGGQAPAPCAELFRYATTTNSLDCISCSPTGTQPLNSATLGTSYINAADFPKRLGVPLLPRNLSADGDRIFFQTPDSLVPADENRVGCSATGNLEKETCLDVYEWEAPGEGSCASAKQDGGCLYLISSGTGDEPSYFADADPEGKNAYFFTASQLVPSDRDQLYDVYDARIDGGLASQNQSQTAPCVSRQACQGPQAGAEPSSSPGTSNFAGPGNAKVRSCKKGFVRRQGKCVKRKTQKKKGKSKSHHKKDHGKKGKKKSGAPKKHRAPNGKGGKK
jgi:hypothetical protein